MKVSKGKKTLPIPIIKMHSSTSSKRGRKLKYPSVLEQHEARRVRDRVRYQENQRQKRSTAFSTVFSGDSQLVPD